MNSSFHNDAVSDTDQNKARIGPGRVWLWASAAIILYVLGVGPVALLENKGILMGKPADFIESAYSPVEWAYDETPLRKPIGLYLRLWSTNFDDEGELK